MKNTYDHEKIQLWMSRNGWTMTRENVVLHWAGEKPAINEWEYKGINGLEAIILIPINSELCDYQIELDGVCDYLASFHGFKQKSQGEQMYETMTKSRVDLAGLNDAVKNER